ncbi:MAG: hypothetical protein JWR10_2006 [Rubritepida sp.]|nr:hypothetical protein [Rubritepida sp.]
MGMTGPAVAAGPGTLRTLALVFLLPMFFQLPYYKPEAGPLYALAKVLPAMLAPLVLYGMLMLRLPDRVLYLVFAVYALAVTPLLSMIHLPNGLVDALAASIKIWPITFYFSAAAALVLLRPSERLLARIAIGFGALTFGLMLLLWIVVPAAWYQPGVFGSNLFSWDEGRGMYIRMPMMLGELTIFWLAQRAARERRLWQILLLAGALAALIAIYKARLPTGVTIIIICMVLALQIPVKWRWALGALAGFPATMGALIYLPRIPGLIGQIFDESLFIRLRSVAIGWNWLWEDPLKLIFGGGSISTFSSYTYEDLFNSPDFWLTDIGWLGVLMEFGLVGTALIVLIHARALTTAYRTQRDDPFRNALFNYVLFEILCSAVYSVMYAPGPVVTVAAIVWWLDQRDRMGIARYETGFAAVAPARGIAVPGWASGRVPRGPMPLG